jgi:Flp pilus assembly protein TadB
MTRFAAALAMSAALITAPAFAETQFRAPEAQSFTTEELQSYGLDQAQTERAVALQEQGYEIRVLSEEEAAQYQAGITDNQWLLLGILAGVIVIAVAID